ncbi:MAG: hypothetical protein A2149_03240 [Candidatus Schekmanbacteria bacterium RBG_16_38_11]|uniref:Fibronectin type-III domain-containing protein n=1 Tax=Candidatus Schekmanbacteria bacterium RBG_16_38_11 TaxID=1817880 RepID=A0A1F7RV30_9BACT|nr:MAG: hypothetical protein A2149_03240 [Candidatus Schekmanbacteria bacterium RBG_16_38_11]
MKKILSCLRLFLSIFVIISFSVFFVSCSNGDKGEKVKIIKEKKSSKVSASAAGSAEPSVKALLTNGETEFRIGALGGTVEVVDPQSPIFGTSVAFSNKDYRENDNSYIRMQWTSGGTVENDTNGNPRILVPTGSVDPNFNKGVNTGLITSNIIVLFFDTIKNGETVTTFPTYFIKEFKDNKFTTFADLPSPEAGTITLIQVLQPPMFTMIIPPNPLRIPSKVKGASGSVLGVGLPIFFGIADDLNQGLVKVGGLPVVAFKNKVPIKIPYSKDAVTALGIDPANLRLYELHINTWRNVTIEISEILASLPSEVTFPGSLADKIRYDADAKLLFFTGMMTTGEQTALLALSADIPYQDAINALFARSQRDGFITANVGEFSIFQVVAPFDKNNSLPIVLNVKPKVKKKKIKIQYKLADAEKDKCDILIEYRETPGHFGTTGWNTITEQKNVSPGIKTFKWDSVALTGSKSGFFQIRITPTQKIADKDIAGGSGFSAVFRINNNPGLSLTPPSGLSGTVTGADTILADPSKLPQVSLTWTASSSSGVTGYNIYRQARLKNGFEKNFRKIGSADGATTESFDDKTLPSTFFEAIYKVASFDSLGNESGFSDGIRLASIVLGGYGYYGG